jgi:thiol-disulfide isomerase/thioredoxin
MVGMPRKVRSLLSAAAVIVGIAGCAGTGNVNTSVTGSLGYQQGDGNIAVYKTTGRSTVGDVNGTTLRGSPLSLASYRGKVVVVDFWSVACAPCFAEEPWFEALSKEFASKGVQFVGIDERDNRAAALSFERHFHVTYPSLYDRDDAFVLDFPGAAPPSTPTTIVLDPHGGIAARVNGPTDYTHLKELINVVRSESA